jgi:cellulose synthase/poly-beta-1,6-N-acetylglucosamine synthase-like glycosyltransferase
MVVFLVVSVLLFFGLLIYPYLIYPAILFFIRKAPHPRFDSKSKASVTLVFCAYNECGSIRDKLANIDRIKAKFPDTEVLAYEDGSSDETLAIMQSRPDLLTVIAGMGRQGKAHGMKKLAAMAKGEILVFTDANVLLDEDAIPRIRGWLGDPTVGGVCGRLSYLGKDSSTTAAVGGAYWRLEERVKDLESASGNVMGADGSIFAIRKALYPQFPDTVLDDLTVSMAVVFSGTRLIKCNDVIAYERLVASRKDEFSRKVRISARAFHTHMFLRPHLREMKLLDRFKYTSRKLIRWFGGLFLVLSMLSAIVLSMTISVWFGLSVVLALVLTLTVGPRLGVRSLDVILEIALAMMATLFGVIKAMRGKTFKTWTPASSR